MEVIVHKIRCPLCGGRLFDINVDKSDCDRKDDRRIKLIIKCWKCHNTIQFNNNYLVQASHFNSKTKE